MTAPPQPPTAAHRRPRIHCNPFLKQGFTLAELLVVITIIGVLYALLLPAITKAKFEAVKSQCMSNQRQIFTLVLAYTTDFNCFPLTDRQGAYQSFGTGSVANSPGTRPVGFGLLTWNGYTTTQELFACPATNYHPYSALQWAGTGGLLWGHFRRPIAFPTRGRIGYLGQSKDKWEGSSNLMYGNASSYALRRSGINGDQGGLSDRRNFDTQGARRLPVAIMGCSQQVDGQASETYSRNYTHDRLGSVTLRNDGSAKWLSMTQRSPASVLKQVPANDPAAYSPALANYLPFSYHFDYPYTFPAQGFWQSAEINFAN